MANIKANKQDGKLKEILSVFHIPNWLFVTLLIVIVLRIPNFFEPYSYGDETIYLTLGEGVRKGMVLYQEIHDNKPPLLYLTAAVAGNLFWFKSILLITNILGITLFYKFSQKLFNTRAFLSIISTILFSIFTTIPFLEGNIVNAENFMIFPTLGAFYILLFKRDGYKNIFLAGILFSVSSLFKIPAIFDFLAIFLVWLIKFKFNKKDFLKIIKKTSVLFIGIAIPILLTFIYYLIKGAFREYLTAAYLQNFGYLSSWRPDAQKDPFLIKNAPLLIRGSIVLAINLILLSLKNKVNNKFIFLTSWMSFSILGITLSERPYPHYLLQAAAPASFLMALVFSSTSMLQVYAIFPLTLFFLVPLYFRFWHYKSINYYSNFINLTTGKISKENYIDKFGGRTRTYYEIAGIVKNLTQASDRLFVWEDSSQLYALTKRFPPFKYIAGYHIKDFSSMENVISRLIKYPTKVIVIFTDSEKPSLLENYLESNYLLFKSTPDYQIWRLSNTI